MEFWPRAAATKADTRTMEERMLMIVYVIMERELRRNNAEERNKVKSKDAREEKREIRI